MTQATLISDPRKRHLTQPTERRIAKHAVLKAAQLTDSDVADWHELLHARNATSSPYVTPEFTKSVGQIRDDVRIGLFRDQSGKLLAIFPYQLRSDGHAEAVGGRLNDVQSIIARPDVELDHTMHASMLEACGLKSYSFHAADEQDGFLANNRFCSIDSHFLDLSNGWQDYLAWAKTNSNTVRRHGQKRRSMERRVGPLRFEFHSEDSAILDQLIHWKRNKYQRTRTFDILSVPWTRQLLERIHQTKTDEFRGLLSVLWAGDQLVAVHIGMLTDQVLHYWFPVFDPQFAKYSPGTELLLRVAEEACRRGVVKLDLGYGDDSYKFRFANGREQMNCGIVTQNRLQFMIAKARYLWRQRLKQIPFKAPLKRIVRSIYPGFGGWNFR